ncbi:MAG TPA: hypothetical protein VKR58_15345 [Aquella sp.]|nr:hypothetical protein [Aquella sp.]
MYYIETYLHSDNNWHNPQYHQNSFKTICEAELHLRRVLANPRQDLKYYRIVTDKVVNKTEYLWVDSEHLRDDDIIYGYTMPSVGIFIPMNSTGWVHLTEDGSATEDKDGTYLWCICRESITTEKKVVMTF